MHPRAWFLLGQARLRTRLRIGSPLRVLNTSPDGMLVESPARLLPGRQVELVLQCGTTREQSPWVVIHSRVGCLRGGSDLRYRAGLRRAVGSGYSRREEPNDHRHELPTAGSSAQSGIATAPDKSPESDGGTGFGRLTET
jgi:hypothetical protein